MIRHRFSSCHPAPEPVWALSQGKHQSSLQASMAVQAQRSMARHGAAHLLGLQGQRLRLGCDALRHTQGAEPVALRRH